MLPFTSVRIDGAPAKDGYVQLLAPDEVVTSGVVARILDDNCIVADLVYISEESLRAPFPLLVLLQRNDDLWSLVKLEPLFSDAANDPLLEEIRAEVVARRFQHLTRRVREAKANAFAAAMFEQDRVTIEPALEEIRSWYRKTKRAWPIE